MKCNIYPNSNKKVHSIDIVILIQFFTTRTKVNINKIGFFIEEYTYTIFQLKTKVMPI